MKRFTRWEKPTTGIAVTFTMFLLWSATVTGSIGSAPLPLIGAGVASRNVLLAGESLEVPVATCPAVVIVVVTEVQTAPETAPMPQVSEPQTVPDIDQAHPAPRVMIQANEAAHQAAGGGESMEMRKAQISLKKLLALAEL